jgi:predicted SAM-dependent methyltransferase
VRINLGAGPQEAPGWINFDRSRSARLMSSRAARGAVKLGYRMGLVSTPAPLQWPETRVHDLKEGIPLPDASVEIVYSSHFLEHIPPTAGRCVLAEAFRVLRPGGWIRIVVPDLRLAVERYLRDDDADAFLEGLMLRPVPKGNRVEQWVRRRLRTDDEGHKWMYDGASLSARLAAAGFVDIEVVGFQEGRCMEAAALDTRPASVQVEAQKPQE